MIIYSPLLHVMCLGSLHVVVYMIQGKMGIDIKKRDQYLALRESSPTSGLYATTNSMGLIWSRCRPLQLLSYLYLQVIWRHIQFYSYQIF